MEMNAFKRTKYACYYTYVAAAPVFSLPAMLFATFRQMYGISYTLLGTLVLVNFCTQLAIDLVFSFFAKHFNIHKTFRVMPLLTAAGLLIYAIVPTLFPEHAYLGFLCGTFIFSVSAGLGEVLTSPMVAALPSDNPQRDMSFLHSLYAVGVLMVVVVSTLFFRLFGTANWMYLTLFWVLLPLVSAFLLFNSKLPDVSISGGDRGTFGKSRRFGLALCTVCIFLGSAAENSMTNWISVYMENVLHIPKTVGDILGIALFAALLGGGRMLYARFGRNITNVLLCGMAGSVVCYFVAGTASNMVIAMLACVLTGLSTSMLWPGTLILMEEKFPNPGVVAYALMAAGGDFGASVAPQLFGVIADTVAAQPAVIKLAEQMSVAPDQISIKVSMFFGGLFPLLGVVLLLYMKRYFSEHHKD